MTIEIHENITRRRCKIQDFCLRYTLIIFNYWIKYIMEAAKINTSKSIYFGIAIWGKDFCQKFLDNCLASLLANGNIPSLPNNGNNKFLFCTTPEDWVWLQSQPLFILLSKYMNPELMPLQMISEEDFQDKEKSMAYKFHIVTKAHSDIVDRMYRDQVIGSLIFPDTLYSNNSFKSVFPHILKKETKAVIACVPRLCTPTLLDNLAELGHIKSGLPTEIPNRDLIRHALMHMNTEVLAQNWNSLYAFDFITDIWLPLRKNTSEGIVTHSFAWCPILMDYSKLASHNIKCLENNTIDGAYLYSNFKFENLYVIKNSDEFVMISHSPHTRLRIKEKILHTSRILNSIKKVIYWRKMIQLSLGGFVDPLKLQLLKIAVVMHINDLKIRDLRIRKQSNNIVDKVLNEPRLMERYLTEHYLSEDLNDIQEQKNANVDINKSAVDDLIMSHALL